MIMGNPGRTVLFTMSKETGSKLSHASFRLLKLRKSGWVAKKRLLYFST